MGLRGEMQNWFDIVELSKGFRESGQNLGEQGRAAQLRELAARAPEMLAQPGGAERYAAESGALGDPAMLRQLAVQKAAYEQEMGQGLTPEQLGALGVGPEETGAFQNTNLAKQKLLLDQRAQREEMDFKKSMLYAEKAAKVAEKSAKGLDATVDQKQAAGFYLMMNPASSQIDDVITNNPGLISRVSGGQFLKAINAPENIRDESLKKFATATRAFINSQLRRESGAAIADSEFANAIEQYIPQAGDTPERLAQKRDNRVRAMASLKASAGANVVSAFEDEYQKLSGETKGKEGQMRAEAITKRISTIKSEKIRQALKKKMDAYGGQIPDSFIQTVNELAVSK